MELSKARSLPQINLLSCERMSRLLIEKSRNRAEDERQVQD